MLTEGEVHCESSTTPASIVVQARLEKKHVDQTCKILQYNDKYNLDSRYIILCLFFIWIYQLCVLQAA